MGYHTHTHQPLLKYNVGTYAQQTAASWKPHPARFFELSNHAGENQFCTTGSCTSWPEGVHESNIGIRRHHAIMGVLGPCVWVPQSPVGGYHAQYVQGTSGLLGISIVCHYSVHTWKGRVVLSQYPLVQCASDHWHYEQTLCSHWPLEKRTRVFIYLDVWSTSCFSLDSFQNWFWILWLVKVLKFLTLWS